MNPMPTLSGERSRTVSSLCVAAALLLLVACADSPVPGAPAVGRPGATQAPMGPAGGPGRAGGPPLAVTTAPPTRELLGAEIEAVGTALANESVEVTAKVSNRIEAIRFTEGQRVAKGAVLVQLDRAQAAAEVAEAEANLAEARRQLRRGQDLEPTQVLSRAQLDQLQTAVTTAEARVAAARSRLDDTVIRAPFAGRTGFRRVSVGGLVSAGAVITTLDDTSVIKLEFNVPQSFLGELAVGLPVVARVEGLGDRVFDGRIATLGSRLDPVTRSIAVRAELPNADGLLKPGMFMSVTLRGRTTPTLVLPEQAIVPEEGRNYVFVVDEGRAVRREVTTGLRRPGRVAIVAGLEDSDRVIIDGTFRARDGAAVVEAGAAPADGAAAPAGAAGVGRS
jgi:membrane fusion protein, multidrug efflux system